MAVNKVVYDGNTLIDLTNDSVTPETLVKGATAHDASGARITGAMGTVDELLETITITDTLTWDGNTAGKTVFDMTGDGSYTYYLVSDVVISLNDLANGVILDSSDINGNGTETLKLTDFAKMTNNVIASQSVSSVLFVLADNTSLYGNTIPKKGIYFMCSEAFGVYASRIKIEGYTGFTKVVDSISVVGGTSTHLATTGKYCDKDIVVTAQGGFADVPTYHFTECARVVENIENFKATHPNYLIFGAVSDIHVYNANATYEVKSKASIRHSAFALEMVGAMAGCDFIANLGDNCWENGIDTDNALLGAKYSINALRPAFDRLTSFNLVGNHDKSDCTQSQYELIGVHNDFDVSATTQIRGFGYKDYTDKKVRVIVLNTCDYLNASGGCALSYEQKDFLMRALDLSAKSNASQWQILLLSHIPLDWNGGDYNYYTDLQAILNAYEDGTTASITVNSSYALRETPSSYATYSGGKLVYNYAGKNSARIIANIHGHVHTNKVGKIANTDIARVATANANPDLNKTESYPDYGDYSITSTEASKIVKVSGTAKDTSATFYCIDLDEQTIYAYGYGADIDRTIPYKAAKYYEVTFNLTNATSSNTSTSVAEYADFETTLTMPNANYQWGTVKITMGGVDITADVWKNSTGKITINGVTGNIVITAVANEPLITETITPHIAPRSTWYGQLVSGKINLASSNAEGALGVSTANSYPYTDRNSKTFYLMPIGSQYCKATLNYSATDGLAVRYYLQAVKDNGGTFTSVATVGKGTNNVITWTKGAADYLLISIEHTDGTKWDWNSAGKTITVTFSNQ